MDARFGGAEDSDPSLSDNEGLYLTEGSLDSYDDQGHAWTEGNLYRMNFVMGPLKGKMVVELDHQGGREAKQLQENPVVRDGNLYVQAKDPIPPWEYETADEQHKAVEAYGRYMVDHLDIEHGLEMENIP